MQPADLEADERAERRPREEIGAAGLAEPARHFGEAEHDDQRRDSANDDCQRTPRAGQDRERGRQAEHAGADDGIDDDRGQVPAPDGAHEGRLARSCRRRGHVLLSIRLQPHRAWVVPGPAGDPDLWLDAVTGVYPSRPVAQCPP